jgi:actin-like protein 6B
LVLSARLDEVSALVLDIGTSTLRAGYAGDDTPKAIIPTSYGFVPVTRDGDVSMTEAADTEGEPAPPKEESKMYMGQHGPSVWREGMQIGNPLSEGLSTSHRIVSPFSLSCVADHWLIFFFSKLPILHLSRL